jgi:hypothetical protein
VVEFNKGAESWEIIPAFRKSTANEATVLYDIPGVSTEWIESAPVEHIRYVNEMNQKSGISGAAKKLSRLVKAWKYYNNVPVSSFYLEMRVAQYLAGEKSFVCVWDICRLLEHLHSIGLGPMNDPKKVSARFYACSTTAKGEEAMSKLATGATRARKAAEAATAGNDVTAFQYCDLLFGGRFPSR